MRRSTMVPNLAAIVLAALMTTWFAVRVAGVQQGPQPHCLNGCAKDKRPPGCCEEPKCDFNEALIGYVVTERIWRSEHYTKDVLDSLRSTDFGLQLSNSRELHEQAISAEIKKILACPDAKPTTSFHLTRSCAIVTPNSKEVRHEDEAIANSPDCPEIAKAEFEAAMLQQSFCQTDLKKADKRLTIQEGMSRVRMQYRTMAYSLQEQFYKFWTSCVQFWAPETRDKILEAFTSALTPPMPSKPAPTAAKRAGGGK